MDPTSKKKEGLAGQTTYRVASQPKIIDNDELGIRVLAESPIPRQSIYTGVEVTRGDCLLVFRKSPFRFIP